MMSVKSDNQLNVNSTTPLYLQTHQWMPTPCFVYPQYYHYYSPQYQTPLFHALPSPFYHHVATFPANWWFNEAPALASFDNNAEETDQEFVVSRDDEKLKKVVMKSPKCPLFGCPVPPRLRGVYRSFPADKKPNKKWMPKRIATQSGTNKTTVMVKNIPNGLRRDFMLKFLDGYSRDYSLEYDFLYLPIDFGNGQNLGYAFVNFTSPATALKFKDIAEGFKWKTSKKTIHVTWAQIQGLESLLWKFAGSDFHCNNSDYLPVHLDPPRNGLDSNPRPPVVIGILGGLY